MNFLCERAPKAECTVVKWADGAVDLSEQDDVCRKMQRNEVMKGLKCVES